VECNQVAALPITPNYISNPVFPHSSSYDASLPTRAGIESDKKFSTSEREIVLKVRVANSEETDFIELDAPLNITYKQLVELIRSELNIDRDATVHKVRKLPNTIVRNDRDVRRLNDYQELELVLTQTSARTSKTEPKISTEYKATVSPKQIDIVY
jgi:hypothetical protein